MPWAVIEGEHAAPTLPWAVIEGEHKVPTVPWAVILSPEAIYHESNLMHGNYTCLPTMGYNAWPTMSTLRFICNKPLPSKETNRDLLDNKRNSIPPKLNKKADELPPLKPSFYMNKPLPSSSLNP